MDDDIAVIMNGINRQIRIRLRRIDSIEGDAASEREEAQAKRLKDEVSLLRQMRNDLETVLL